MLIETISKHIYLQENDKQQIAGSFKKEVFNNGEILLKEGSYTKHLYFIEQGFIRSFYNKDNGTEKTHWVYTEQDFVTAWYSFFTDRPSFESLQTLGKTSIYSISILEYRKLYESNESFNIFINSYYQHIIAEMDFLTKTFTHLSAKEKYQYLLDTSPNLLREIKLGYIASLLDISQETLSRVRGQN